MVEFFKRLPYQATLAIVAFLILGGGLLLKPVQRKVEVISESERARLQELSQKKTFDDMAQLFVRLGERVGNRIVHLEPGGQAGLIAGAAGEIVSAGLPVETAVGGTVKVQGEQSAWNAKVSQAPAHGLVAKLKVASGMDVAPIALADARAPSEGSWLVLVGRGADGQRFVAPGIFSGFARIDCGGVTVRTMRTSIPQTRDAAGAGIFDLDGTLLGMATRCGDRVEAVAAAEVPRLLGLREDLAQLLFRNRGLMVEPAGEDVRAALRLPEGLLVTAVQRDQPGVAGFAPGDVIVSVNGAPATAVENLRPWLGATPMEFEIVSRGRKRVVKPGEDREAISFLSEPGLAIGALPEGSAAGKAGIVRGDRLIEIDGRGATDGAAAARLLSAARPHFVIVRRGDVDRGYFLPAAAEAVKP